MKKTFSAWIDTLYYISITFPTVENEIISEPAGPDHYRMEWLGNENSSTQFLTQLTWMNSAFI